MKTYMICWINGTVTYISANKIDVEDGMIIFYYNNIPSLIVPKTSIEYIREG